MTSTLALPPTSVLPLARRLPECSSQDISIYLEYLQCLCNPPVRGSRRRQTAATKKQAESSIVLDPFERAHAIRWLTTLISYGDLWESEELIRDAASILALCAGTSAAGVIHRTLTFPFDNDSGEISIRLQDIPLDNHDFESVGAQTWGGACVLAEMIAENPHAFLPRVKEDMNILELGAGTGLVSLALGQICAKRSLPAKIVATDFYPSVLANLKANIQANSPTTSPSPVHIVCDFLDWQNPPSDTPPYDIVLGADIVYDHRHAPWIKNCLRNLLRKSPSALFHLVIPLRSTFSAESGTIDAVFIDDLVVQSKEEIVCDVDGESDEVVVYAYYRIGWASV
jgi:predicted nicotinamide N-methyase